MSGVKPQTYTVKPFSKSEEFVLTVNEAKDILVQALGDKSQKYFNQLQEWFKFRTNKDVIDTVARRYLQPELLHYHEVFILTLLHKVGGFVGKSPVDVNQKIFPDGLVCPRMSKHYRPMSPAQPEALQLDPNAFKVDWDKNLPPKVPLKMAHDSCLPSQALIHGRLMLSAWDHGLEDVDPEAAAIMVEATKTLLKNVLTAIIQDVRPHKKGTWSHPVYEGEIDEKMLEPKKRYDIMETIMEDYDDNAMINLLPREGEAGYVPPEFYLRPFTSDCDGPQPEEEVSITLSPFDVFNSLMKNRMIIPHYRICALTIMRASLKMRQGDGEETVIRNVT